MLRKQQDGRSELTNVFFEGKALELQIGETGFSGRAAAASGSNQ